VALPLLALPLLVTIDNNSKERLNSVNTKVFEFLDDWRGVDTHIQNILKSEEARVS
jgi:hypothetical protein